MILARQLTLTAQKMISAPDRFSAARVLRRRIPELFQHIQSTRNAPAALRLWGNSWNYDEHANQTIVDPSILQVISDLSSVPMEGEILHAGLQHTFGYLFSLIETPFGHKRDRWINGELDAAFGLTSPVLSAIPAQGTLLFNVTYFLGRIAFQGCRREVARLRRLRSLIAPELVDLNYRGLQVARLTESISSPTSKNVKISLVSDFVRYPQRPKRRGGGSSNSALLIYSLVDNREQIRKLITAFPISLETVHALTDPHNLGNRQPVKLCYNICVSSFDDSVVTGSRSLRREWWHRDEP